jgi:TRAP-type uncharacterized transport system substrate-binding protein
MVLVLMASVFAVGCPPPDPAVRPPERVVMRFGTAGVGTFGYKIGAMLMTVLDEEFPAHYEFIVFPFPSTTAAMIDSMHGGIEVSYTADIGMTQMATRTGPFVPPFEPREAELIHTFYIFPMDTFLAVPARDAHLYDSWSDLSGLTTFFAPAGFMNFLNIQRAFRDALGYTFTHLEVATAAVPDALDAGTIKATALYSTAGVSPAPWVMEVDLRADITILNPTPEERTRMQAAGLTLSRIVPGEIFTQDVGVTEIWGVMLLFGFNVRPDISQEFVYNMLTAIYERRADLYRLEPGFGPLNQDFVGLQVAGISANPNVPVHPGLHQFLVEKGAWNPAWTIAS